MVMLYIPICDRVVYLFLHGLVGSAQDYRAESAGFDPGSGNYWNLFLCFFLSLINK